MASRGLSRGTDIEPDADDRIDIQNARRTRRTEKKRTDNGGEHTTSHRFSAADQQEKQLAPGDHLMARITERRRKLTRAQNGRGMEDELYVCVCGMNGTKTNGDKPMSSSVNVNGMRHDGTIDGCRVKKEPRRKRKVITTANRCMYRQTMRIGSGRDESYAMGGGKE